MFFFILLLWLLLGHYVPSTFPPKKRSIEFTSITRATQQVIVKTFSLSALVVVVILRCRCNVIDHRVGDRERETGL